jgi:hypothetical protein
MAGWVASPATEQVPDGSEQPLMPNPPVFAYFNLLRPVSTQFPQLQHHPPVFLKFSARQQKPNVTPQRAS